MTALLAHVATEQSTENEKYRRFISLRVNDRECAALVDSGNLWRNVISCEFLHRIGFTLADLQPVGISQISTAKSGASLKVLGELKTPIKFKLGSNRHPFKDRPVVVEGLSMDYNIGGPFLKENKLDQLHSDNCLKSKHGRFEMMSSSEERLYGSESAFASLVTTKRVRAAANSNCFIQLRAREVKKRLMPAGAGYVVGSIDFMTKHDVSPWINAMVTADEKGLLYAGVMNTTSRAITIPAGTAYGVFTLAVDQKQHHLCRWRVATMGLDPDLGTTEEKVATIKADLGETGGPDPETLTKKERRAWLAKEFRLHESPVLKTPDQLEKALDLLDNFYDIFSFDGSFGKTELLEHRIYTPNDHPPIKTKQRNINPKLEESLKEQLDVWVKQQVIEPSSSPWNFGLVAAPKKNGKIRWCVDYRRLNDITMKDSYPLPNIEDNLARLSKSRIFSGIDGAGAYHVVSVHPDDRPKTAFATPWGSWQFSRMPFGLTNAPATYCRLVQLVLQGIPYSVALPYIDDTCVHSVDLPGHFVGLARVFAAHRKAGLKLQPSKCSIFREEVEYLGHIISAEGIKPVPKYIEIVENWPIPRTKTEARAFLGKVGYYRKFIKGYAALARPWTDVTGKGDKEEEKRPLDVNDEMEKAFYFLRQSLTKAPILAYPQFDSEEPFILDTDWSHDSNTIGAVLSQKQDGHERVICYGAKKLGKSALNYPPTKGELQAVIYFMKAWRYYLQHKTFLLRTDHSALRQIKTMEEPSGMIRRWLTTLSNFKFEVQHRAGTKHGNADALSRISHAESASDSDSEAEVIASLCNEKPDWSTDKMKAEQMADEELELVRRWVNRPEPPEREEVRRQSATVQAYAALLPQLVLDGNSILRHKRGEATRICLPRKLWADAIEYAHTFMAHRGRDQTLATFQKNFFIPSATKEVAMYVQGCPECQAKPGAPKPQKHTHVAVQDGYPFQRISIDFVGPLPESDRGNKYLLTVKETFTRWLEAFPIPDANKENTCRVLEEEIFCRYGIPEHLHTDHGTQFTSHLMDEVSKELGMSLTFAPVANPKSNPVERSHKDLGPALKSLCMKHEPGTWEDYLPRVLLSSRVAVNSTTGFSPYYLMFGRDPSLPLDQIFGKPPEEEHGKEKHHKYTKRLRDRIDKVQAWARRNIGDAMRRQCRRYHAQKRLFVDGSKVWLFTPTQQAGRGKKLSTHWSGPWTVLRKINDVLYTIQPPASWGGRFRIQTIGIDRLKAYKPPVRPGYPPLELRPGDEDDLDPDGNERMDFFGGGGGGGGGLDPNGDDSDLDDSDFDPNDPDEQASTESEEWETTSESVTSSSATPDVSEAPPSSSGASTTARSTPTQYESARSDRSEFHTPRQPRPVPPGITPGLAAEDTSMAWDDYGMRGYDGAGPHEGVGDVVENLADRFAEIERNAAATGDAAAGFEAGQGAYAAPAEQQAPEAAAAAPPGRRPRRTAAARGETRRRAAWEDEQQSDTSYSPEKSEDMSADWNPQTRGEKPKPKRQKKTPAVARGTPAEDQPGRAGAEEIAVETEQQHQPEAGEAEPVAGPSGGAQVQMEGRPQDLARISDTIRRFESNQ